MRYKIEKLITGSWRLSAYSNLMREWYVISQKSNASSLLNELDCLAIHLVFRGDWSMGMASVFFPCNA